MDASEGSCDEIDLFVILATISERREHDEERDKLLEKRKQGWVVKRKIVVEG